MSGFVCVRFFLQGMTKRVNAPKRAIREAGVTEGKGTQRGAIVGPFNVGQGVGYVRDGCSRGAGQRQIVQLVMGCAASVPRPVIGEYAAAAGSWLLPCAEEKSEGLG